MASVMQSTWSMLTTQVLTHVQNNPHLVDGVSNVALIKAKHVKRISSCDGGLICHIHVPVDDNTVRVFVCAMKI